MVGPWKEAAMARAGKATSERAGAREPGTPPARWLRRAVLLACASCILAGCATDAQDRARRFNEDGVYLFEHGQFASAREDFEEALRLQPKDPGMLYNVGQCYDRQNDTARAQQFYQQCLQEDSNHAPCRHALAVLLFRAGRRSEADSMIEDWLSRQPKRADPYVEDAWRLRQDGELDQALARLQQARDLEPNNLRAKIELGLLFEVMEHPERAATLYDQVLAADPSQTAVAERLNQLRARKIGKPLPD
jgi:Tfp pilus assembly protein PilF